MLQKQAEAALNVSGPELRGIILKVSVIRPRYRRAAASRLASPVPGLMSQGQRLSGTRAFPSVNREEK